MAETLSPPIVLTGSTRAEIRRGFVAALPLWLGVVPFAAAFAILARTSGLSILETQLLSMLVFAGSAQLAFVNLVNDHAGSIAIVLTVLLLNLRHVLYGLSLNSYFPAKTEPPRPVLAYGLVDESYGLTIRALRDGRGSPGYLFGVSASLFVSYGTATLAGALLGSRLPDPEKLGLATIFPLSFLALLLPLIRTRIEIAVAVTCGVIGLVASQYVSGGVVVLTATLAGATLGTLLERRGEKG